MGLDTKTLAELHEIATGLRRYIKSHPGHCEIEEIELQDVEQWIREYPKEEAGPDGIIY